MPAWRTVPASRNMPRQLENPLNIGAMTSKCVTSHTEASALFDIRLQTFSPAEAAAISGVNATLTRAYRHRGYLSAQHGHSPFTVFGLAELMFVKAMAETSCPPDFLKRLRDWATSGIVYQALRNEDAFDSPDISLDIDLRAFASQILPRYSALEPDCRRVIPGRFLIIWADKSCKWVESLGDVDLATPAQIAGPVVLIDQRAVGDAIRERAGRPLVHVSRKAAVPQNHFAKETV